jgi:hypothetical protein
MSAFTVQGPLKQRLRRASRKAVEDYFLRLPERERTAKWLRQNNRYRCRCTGLYEADIKAAPPTVNHRHVTDYVSASAPAHVIDGWSILGRAVDSTLRGDANSAIHFGYYAELRAAMGLLAAEGLGIFRDRHPIADVNGITDHFPQKGRGHTHMVIWPVLRYWATLSRAADLLEEVVCPNSLRLSDWFEAANSSPPVRAVAQHWLRSWGLDLQVVDEDHDLRNIASYRPSEFQRAAGLDVHEIAEFVEELWRLFEPGPARRFPVVERLLLRNALRRWSPSPPTDVGLRRLGLGPSESKDWATFLALADNPMPLRLAEKPSPIDDPRCHLGVVSRAALLLFVATSAVRRLLTNAAYTSDTMAFWWTRHGEDRGLWPIGEAPDSPLDTWADILVALDKSRKWRAGNPAKRPSLHGWRQSELAAVEGFGAFELVGIWGLLP